MITTDVELNIPEWVTRMSKEELLGEIKLYKGMFTERRGGISRPEHGQTYVTHWQEYQWFHEALGSR